MSYIKIEVPNDDHIALRAFGKALEEMALAHGAPLQLKINEEALSKALGELQQAAPHMMNVLRCEGEELQGKRKEPEIDTTAQQVETLATHVITSQEKAGDPVDLGDGNVSQGYRIEVEELPTTDKTGTPWDERIHSASKALNADGTWRLRRKPKDMDDGEWAATVQKIEQELRFPQEPAAVTPVMTDEEVKAFDDIEPPVTPPGDDFHTDADVVSEQTVAGIPPIPVPPPVVLPPAPVDDTWTFPKLMTFLTERQGKIDVATVNMLLAQDGIASLPELNAHPDKIGPFVARVKAHLGE